TGSPAGMTLRDGSKIKKRVTMNMLEELQLAQERRRRRASSKLAAVVGESNDYCSVESLTPYYALLHLSGRSSDPLIIETTKGRIKGVIQESPSGGYVDAWLGIPYAQPPLKPDLSRLTYPGFHGAEMWNANTPRHEDCLYISVYVPKPRPMDAPVMVWIFGGGFYSGSSTLDVYDPKIIVSTESVIVVSIQYRVGSLGFLFLNDPSVPGNAGLYDQLMAMTFIKDNIAKFGGNPNNITLFGESAGAVSISFHLLSPLSRDLFNQAIMQSGGATAPWAIFTHEEAIIRARFLADGVGCPYKKDQHYEMIDCLKKANTSVIIDKEWPQTSNVVDFPFVAVLDGAFLDEHPRRSLEEGRFKKCPVLLGSNTEEGNFWLLYFLHEKFAPAPNFKMSIKEYRAAINRMFIGESKIVKDAIAYEYTDWLDPGDPIKMMNALDKIVGDFHFTCSVNEVAHRYAQYKQAVFMYYFMQRSSTSPWPDWMGVLHGDEINFVFGEPLDPSKGYSKEDVELSRRILRYWANFARTGNPNMAVMNGNWTQIYWPVHEVFEREYLILASNTSQTRGRGPRVKQCAFWMQFLPQLHSAMADAGNNTNSTTEPLQCASTINDSAGPSSTFPLDAMDFHALIFRSSGGALNPTDKKKRRICACATPPEGTAPWDRNHAARPHDSVALQKNRRVRAKRTTIGIKLLNIIMT
ncbi:unnamed protein product, partial [Cyprideis torosa]